MTPIASRPRYPGIRAIVDGSEAIASPTGRSWTSCRSPGPRDASHRISRADGTPTPEIMATQDDRLANWRGLEEFAGMREVVPAKK